MKLFSTSSLSIPIMLKAIIKNVEPKIMKKTNPNIGSLEIKWIKL